MKMTAVMVIGILYSLEIIGQERDSVTYTAPSTIGNVDVVEESLVDPSQTDVSAAAPAHLSVVVVELEEPVDVARSASTRVPRIVLKPLSRMFPNGTG